MFLVDLFYSFPVIGGAMMNVTHGNKVFISPIGLIVIFMMYASLINKTIKVFVTDNAAIIISFANSAFGYFLFREGKRIYRRVATAFPVRIILF